MSEATDLRDRLKEWLGKVGQSELLRGLTQSYLESLEPVIKEQQQLEMAIKPVQVYRVYEAFHDPAESGTVEYGVYSSQEKALERIEQVWTEKKYPPPDDKDDGGWYAYAMMDRYKISIDRFNLDIGIDQKDVGYT